MKANVLIVDDDRELLRVLEIDLRHHGYQVVTTDSAADVLPLFREVQPDIIMLDVALRGASGLVLCEKLRKISDVPILMMTAHAVSEEAIAYGLNLGADEYMVKPLGSLELRARLKALLRRANVSTDTPYQRYEDDYLVVDLELRRVFVDGTEIRLTPTEYKLLTAFVSHRGQVLTFERLLTLVWGDAYANEHHYPRVYVSHLRRKIEPDSQNPTYIQNEYGVGYRFIGRS